MLAYNSPEFCKGLLLNGYLTESSTILVTAVVTNVYITVEGGMVRSHKVAGIKLY